MTINYPEIEAKGFIDFKRRLPNPYPTGSDNHEAWNIGAHKRYEMEREIDQFIQQDDAKRAAERKLADRSLDLMGQDYASRY